jgi:hypothetical protein
LYNHPLFFSNKKTKKITLHNVFAQNLKAILI